jgi:FkbM family methyltransferase
VYALEPAREPFALLERNTVDRPDVVAHAIGLYSDDRSVPLHHGALDSVTASVGASALTRADAETVQLRAVADWLREQAIDRIDVLKLDTEGCEIPILEGMHDQLGAVQVVHVEFHSDADRKAIDRLVGATHVLVSGHIHHAHRGELTYVANAIASDPEHARHEIRVEL